MTATWNIDIPPADYYGPDPTTLALPSDITERLDGLLRELADAPLIALDTETTGLTLWKDLPLYFSLAWGTKRCTVHSSLLGFFDPLFKDPTKFWVFANAKYDAHILANVGIVIFGKLIDTQVMHSLLYEDSPHNLKYMCKHLGGWTWGDFQDQFGKIGKNQSAEGLIRKAEREDFPRLVEYAANDSWGTLLCYEKLRGQLGDAGTHSLFRNKPPYIETLWDLFYKIEVPYTSTLWRMERYGVKVDRQRLEDARPQAETEINRLERELWKLHGGRPKLSSPADLREWLIERKGLKPLKLTKGGASGNRQASVDAKFLEYHANRGSEECRLLMEYRGYTKLLSTYINGLHALLDQYGRIHTKYNQDVARTGRLSSSEPNLQNIPKLEKDHWALRKAFVPEPGFKILCFDYGQLEMRLLAAASLEKSMIDMIQSGKDIHMGNAELVFGIPYDDLVTAKKTKEAVKDGQLPESAFTDYMDSCLKSRAAVKSIGFGMIYGMGTPKLANELGIPLHDAEDKMEQFMRAYPAVTAFTEEAIEETRKTGYAFTVLGRRRNVPEIMSRNPIDRSRGERLAVNTQIQGSAADVVKMAQILYDALGFERDYGCRQIMQVHDELVFECPDESVEAMCPDIKRLMEHPFPEDLAIQLVAEGGPGPSWGDAK